MRRVRLGTCWALTLATSLSLVKLATMDRKMLYCGIRGVSYHQ